MKRALLYAAAFAAIFSSCEKTDIKGTTADADVHFVIDKVVTRVTTTDNVTTFVDGDMIAISSTGLETDLANAVYTYTEAGLQSPQDGIVPTYVKRNEANFVAWYPSDLRYSENAINMTVPNVQTAENFHANMFMVATAAGSKDSPEVKLSFKHQLAWVKIILANMEGTSVALCNVCPTATWTPTGVTASGTAARVETYARNANEFWVLVPAQNITSGTELISIETANNKFAYTLTSDLKLSSSKIKTITLTLNENKVNADISVDTSDDITWEDDEAFNGEANQTPAIEIISAEAGNFANVTLNTNVTGKQSLSEGWGTLISNDYATITVSNDAAEAVIAVKGTDGAWYNKSLCYLAMNARPGEYILSFSCKVDGLSGSAGANDMQVNIMQGGTAENIYYPFNSSNSAYIACTTSYVAKRLTVNIPSNADLTKGLIVLFTTKTANGQTLRIKDVTLIENR